ncbi:hypothetical protein VTP01DRAFT_577 [Rhizomucor pusillus]|uniref:uncharacterized protein n=1 Tax=Rhizomucor pusillus TaxID=4840 RepID=UPI0037432C05
MLLPHSLFVITGANRGFGRAVVLALAEHAEHRTTLVLAGRKQDELDSVRQQVVGKNINVHTIAGISLASAKDAQRTVLNELQQLVNQITPPLTHATLINNAGSTGDLSKRVPDYNAEEIQQYCDFNIASYACLVSGFIKALRSIEAFAPELTIVNISSLLAVQPFSNWALYASGKAARDMFLKVLALEEKSVRTLSYAPGPLDNEMQRQVRETLGDPEQKQLYTNLANEGKLVTMEESARKLVMLLRSNTFESGAHVDFYD